MDLIGSIKFIENGLGGRKSNQGERKFGKKSGNAEHGKNDQADANHSLSEYDTRLGRKIDTTA
jgi:hypothetical protein